MAVIPRDLSEKIDDCCVESDCTSAEDVEELYRGQQGLISEGHSPSLRSISLSSWTIGRIEPVTKDDETQTIKKSRHLSDQPRGVSKDLKTSKSGQELRENLRSVLDDQRLDQTEQLDGTCAAWGLKSRELEMQVSDTEQWEDTHRLLE